MIDRVINVLLLEDRPVDAELTKRAILKFAPSAMITVAKSEAEFSERVHWTDYDIMLADYHLPGYNGLEALLYVREHFPHLPFVFVTGQLNNEQKAAEAVLRGANGYVLKDKMERLEGSVTTALERARERKLAADAQSEKRQQRSLMLQKAIYLLSNTEASFEGKAAIQDALQKVLELEV